MIHVQNRKTNAATRRHALQQVEQNHRVQPAAQPHQHPVAWLDDRP
jgi:hypothetical protein